MKCRRFGKLNWAVSALGFGVMRLPTLEGDVARIDESVAIKMIRYAIDHGVNYVDTAYPYHQGNSEILLGKALQEGYGEKVKVATKMPTWLIKSQKDMTKFLDEQLHKLKLDYVDFYLLHGLEKKRWHQLKKLEVLEWGDRQIAEGKIRHLGFSFHDEYSTFKEIVDSYEWTLCQIQYNYMDTEYQAGTKGLKYAASKGLAVVVMEPIAGGRLAINPPEDVQKIWKEEGGDRTPAEWALQWVWNHTEVSVALSGMSTMDQVIENVQSASRSGPDTLNKTDFGLISKIQRKYRELGFVGCTNCGYCMPCPEGVDIPQILALYNEYFAKERDNHVKEEYWKCITPESNAKRCVKCGKCEELCPQQLPVRKILSGAAWVFEQKS